MAHCPNVKPAFETLEKMGYKNVKLLYLPDDFEQDWAQKGYPVQNKYHTILIIEYWSYGTEVFIRFHYARIQYFQNEFHK